MSSRAQDGLITRIEKFPTPYATHLQIQSSIPKSISKNRQVFEAIFNFLQSHPCYLINWIKKDSAFFDSPEDLQLLLYAVFGKREMKDNQRVLNILMLIAKAMFDEEARVNNFKELCSVFRTDSPFRTIFKMIFEMQSANLGFNKEIIARLLHKLQEVYDRIKEETELEFTETQADKMLQEVFLYILDVIRKRVDLLGGMDLSKVTLSRDQNHLTLQVLSLLDYVYQKLAASARENLRSKGVVDVE